MNRGRNVFLAVPVMLLGSCLGFAQDAPSTGINVVTGSRVPAVAQKPRPQAPSTYGTTAVSYYVIDSAEFHPIASSVGWSGINNFQLRYSTSAGLVMWAPLHLPAGALVTYIEIDYYDNSITGELQAAFAVCGFTGESCAFQPGSAACSPLTICSGAADAFGYSQVSTDLTPNGIVINNFNNRYMIAVGNTTTDGSTAWSQIIIGYVLQVSPAPSSATFPDVPTTDFGFQFVEALYASGITGGCGGGLYCPDSPVTRRQMAIFIAKALGLQWN